MMTQRDRLAHNAITGWLAHQCRRRFALMLAVNKRLRRAYENELRDRKRHAPTRQDIRAKQAAVHSMLRGRAVM
jgi:hypothetical protein